MKIARVEALPMYPKVIKEAWVEDEYVWPSQPPSFLIRVTTENGEYGVGEVTSQVWYLGETEAHIAACVALYDKALRGKDPRNFALRPPAYGGPGRAAACRAAAARARASTWRSTISPARRSACRSMRLLGGAYRTEFEMLTNLYHKTPEAMAAACVECVKEGFKGLKIKVGDTVLAKGWNRDNLADRARHPAAPRSMWCPPTSTSTPTPTRAGAARNGPSRC